MTSQRLSQATPTWPPNESLQKGARPVLWWALSVGCHWTCRSPLRQLHTAGCGPRCTTCAGFQVVHSIGQERSFPSTTANCL